MKAYAWRTGRIDFGEQVPDGALLICSGEELELKAAIGATARLAYDDSTWLVPSVTEAGNVLDAIDALITYRAEVLKRLDGGRHVSRAPTP